MARLLLYTSVSMLSEVGEHSLVVPGVPVLPQGKSFLTLVGAAGVPDRTRQCVIIPVSSCSRTWQWNMYLPSMALAGLSGATPLLMAGVGVSPW